VPVVIRRPVRRIRADCRAFLRNICHGGKGEVSVPLVPRKMPAVYKPEPIPTAGVGPDQREAFYEVFARNMRDLGTPVLPWTFFERLIVAFPDLVVFGAVYRGDQPLAGGCGFMWRGEFEMTWAGALREARTLSANMLLYWSFMEQMMSRGVRVFNFGRCTPGGGTHHFKRQWGGADVPLPWCQYAPRGVKATPSPNDPTYSWGPRLWRRLPLPIANRLGPLLVRFLP